MKFEYISNIEFDGFFTWDWPDNSDLFIISADYKDRQMTDEELDMVNDNHDFINELFNEHYF